MPKVSEKTSDIRRQAMQVLLYIAGGHGPRKRRLRQVEEVTGFQRGRIHNCWYAETNRVAVRIEELKKARMAALEVARNEHRRHAEIIAHLEALQDEEFHSAQVAALRSVALG
jgi:hypothetical protein